MSHTLAPERAPQLAVAIEAHDVTLRPAISAASPRISTRLPMGQVLAVYGPPASGRSALLLTLTGRARTSDGDLRVLGSSLPKAASRVRLLTSVARIGESGGPDLTVSVAEAIRERAFDEGVSAERAAELVRQTMNLLQLSIDPAVRVESLSPLRLTWLTVALATIRPAQLLVLDDLDDGLTVAEQHLVWNGLRKLARTGPAVVASTAQREAILTDITMDLENADFTEIASSFPRQRTGEDTGTMVDSVDPAITGEHSEERID